MKRILTILCAMLLVLGVSAQKKKAIVAYFSATGTTEAVAKQLAKEAKAEIYAITPAKAYTSADLDWHNKQSRSSVEMANENSRPALKAKKNLAKYDVIYIGFPIWWGVAPRIVNTFIEQANLKGKTVVPFATSGSSTIDKAVSALKASYPNVKWQNGYLLNKPTNADIKKVVK